MIIVVGLNPLTSLFNTHPHTPPPPPHTHTHTKIFKVEKIKSKNLISAVHNKSPMQMFYYGKKYRFPQGRAAHLEDQNEEENEENLRKKKRKKMKRI